MQPTIIFTGRTRTLISIPVRKDSGVRFTPTRLRPFFQLRTQPYLVPRFGHAIAQEKEC